MQNQVECDIPKTHNHSQLGTFFQKNCQPSLDCSKIVSLHQMESTDLENPHQIWASMGHHQHSTAEWHWLQVKNVALQVANTTMEDPTGPNLSGCPQACAGSLAQQKTLSYLHTPLMFDDDNQVPQVQQSAHVSCQCRLHLPRPCATKSGWKQLHMNLLTSSDLDKHVETLCGCPSWPVLLFHFDAFFNVSFDYHAVSDTVIPETLCVQSFRSPLCICGQRHHARLLTDLAKRIFDDFWGNGKADAGHYQLLPPSPWPFES